MEMEQCLTNTLLISKDLILIDRANTLMVNKKLGCRWLVVCQVEHRVVQLHLHWLLLSILWLILLNGYHKSIIPAILFLLGLLLRQAKNIININGGYNISNRAMSIILSLLLLCKWFHDEDILGRRLRSRQRLLLMFIIYHRLFILLLQFNILLSLLIILMST